MDNIFDIENLDKSQGEVFESLLTNGDLLIERIVTLSPYSEPGEWYDQDMDEWVILLQGSATLEYGAGKKVALKPGDHILIPARMKHRVSQSSAEEPCIWLAVHGKLK